MYIHTYNIMWWQSIYCIAKWTKLPNLIMYLTLLSIQYYTYMYDTIKINVKQCVLCMHVQCTVYVYISLNFVVTQNVCVQCHVFFFILRRSQYAFEERMRSLQFAPLKRLNRSKKNRALSCEQYSTAQEQITSEGEKMSSDANDGVKLPPLVSKVKVQGPFRQPEEVWCQRLKPLSPTLRVATEYNSVEIARYVKCNDIHIILYMYKASLSLSVSLSLFLSLSLSLCLFPYYVSWSLAHAFIQGRVKE